MPAQESTTPWARETPGRIAVQYGRFARIANKMTAECIVTKGSAVVSSQTSQAEVQSLINRAVKLGDPKLAADIRQFASTRQYGLVFEHNRPERMRLYGKPVTARDVVQVLPRRGTAESAENRLLWRISALHDGKADLYAYVAPDYADNDGEPRTVDVSDLVAVSEYDQPIYAGLRETGRVERGGDKPCQVVINGENYHALEALAFAYAGKVDCIYIDPPYNTGAKDWKYNNDYVDATDQYRHSKWLAFMERRLKLAKQLLNPKDSVLIVTIDEKEYLRLGMLLEQTFPNASMQMVSDVINPRAGVARSGSFTRTEEYLYIVRLGDATVVPNLLTDETDEETSSRKSPIWFSLMRTGSNSARKDRPNLFYPIWVDDDGKLYEVGDALDIGDSKDEVTPPADGLHAVFPLRPDGRENTWQLGAETLRKAFAEGTARISKRSGRFTVSYLRRAEKKRIEEGEIEVLGKDDNGALILQHKEGVIRVKAPRSIWQTGAHDAGLYGSSLVSSLVDNRRFPFPKSLYAVEDALRFFVSDKPDALILDFFAGSGTTLHAVNLLNAEDGGHRRCICVTNNEVSADEAKKFTADGFRQGDPEWEERGIARYVTWPRTKCSIEGIDVNGNPLKGNYLGSDTPMADGFKANAIFYDLTYQDPTAVRLGMAFRNVAPLLWLRAGARGRCIMDEKPNWDIADTYAVLFDPSRAKAFVSELAKAPHVGLVYVVTDDERRFASVSAMLGGLPAVRLYADYLRSFRISAEGANN